MFGDCQGAPCALFKSSQKMEHFLFPVDLFTNLPLHPTWKLGIFLKKKNLNFCPYSNVQKSVSLQSRAEIAQPPGNVISVSGAFTWWEIPPLLTCRDEQDSRAGNSQQISVQSHYGMLETMVVAFQAFHYLCSYQQCVIYYALKCLNSDEQITN